ncbi:MAG: glycogen/starch/alpha-glucan phosphorylase, partial [Candidatus Omnitrophota bacterium]|nr:glycogen/starch/alpha-glucan phosphorylase [Candidatus Omnitrophota bacterium]
MFSIGDDFYGGEDNEDLLKDTDTGTLEYFIETKTYADFKKIIEAKAERERQAQLSLSKLVRQYRSSKGASIEAIEEERIVYGHRGRAYKLLARLGEGANSVVYLGQDLKTGKEVAVKETRPELKGARRRDSFSAFEVRYLRRNKANPYAVRLIDWNLDEEIIVLERVAGFSLEEIGAALRESEDWTNEQLIELLRIIKIAAVALLDTFNLSQTLLPDAIKPGNCMFTWDGKFKLIDFKFASTDLVIWPSFPGSQIGEMLYSIVTGRHTLRKERFIPAMYLRKQVSLELDRLITILIGVDNAGIVTYDSVLTIEEIFREIDKVIATLEASANAQEDGSSKEAPDRIKAMPTELASFKAIELGKLTIRDKNNFDFANLQALGSLESKYQERLKQIIGFISHSIHAPPVEFDIVIEPALADKPSSWGDFVVTPEGKKIKTFHLQVILLTDLVPDAYRLFIAKHEAFHINYPKLSEKRARLDSLLLLVNNPEIAELLSEFFRNNPFINLETSLILSFLNNEIAPLQLSLIEAAFKNKFKFGENRKKGYISDTYIRRLAEILINSPEKLKEMFNAVLKEWPEVKNYLQSFDIFIIPDNFSDQGLAKELYGLNRLNKINGQKAVIDAVLGDNDLMHKVSLLIRTQDRQDDTQGYFVNRRWAEEFKKEALGAAIKHIEGRDIFILQMEYELSMKFIQEFCEYLVKLKGSSLEDAVYNTGELAKLLMAGGLGSFKPDLVRGWYAALESYWGSIEAKNRLRVFGILYAKAIKGQGPIKAHGAVANEDIIDIAKSSMLKLSTYRDIELPYQDLGTGEWKVMKVNVDIYMNPYSELQEYWFYCPQVFHEAYCGENNDVYRAIQTLLYRKVLLRFIKEGIKEGAISHKLLFSTSEVNTTLAIPAVVQDEYKNDSDFSDLVVHHYNHTIVPAGMPSYYWYMFDILKISEEFRDAIYNGVVDLVKITGRVSDFITGCSTAHTRILRQQIFKEFADKVIEDDLFGNSEGSDIERWEGMGIQELIKKYMLELGAIDYYDLFDKLDNNQKIKSRFIQELLEIRRDQKEVFVNELLKGTFGNIGISREELEKSGVDLLNMPFFTFVRRFVTYKCPDFIIDAFFNNFFGRLINHLDNPDFREQVVKYGAVIFIGGRRFDSFYEKQQDRVRELIRIDPRMKYHLIFISNHNVFTSWLIHQATNFGGMFSWQGKEAGPTSFSNAQQNGAPTFATADGVIPERVKPIVRDAQGKIIQGTGYIVDYDSADDNGNIKPNSVSFVQKLEEACKDYFNTDDYGVLAYNTLRMGITQGDAVNQAKGLLMVWGNQAARKAEVLSSRGYSGLDNALYSPAIQTKIDEGEFFAVKFEGGKFVPVFLGHESIRQPTGKNVSADNLVFLQGLYLSPEELKLLEGATLLFIDGLDEVVKQVVIRSGLSPPANCFGSHYGIYRNQYYFDSTLLNNPLEFIRHLHHELRERNAVMLGLSPEEKSIPLSSRSSQLRIEINHLTRVQHDILVLNNGEDVDVESLRDTLTKAGAKEITVVKIDRRYSNEYFEFRITFVVEMELYGKKGLFLIKTRRTWANEPEDDACRVLTQLNVANSGTVVIKNYFVSSYAGDIDLKDFSLAQFKESTFRRALCFELGKVSAASYILGLGDRSSHNIRLCLVGARLPYLAINIDLTTAFCLINSPSNLDEQRIVLDFLMGQAREAKLTREEVEEMIRVFTQGFVEQYRSVQEYYFKHRAEIDPSLAGLRVYPLIVRRIILDENEITKLSIKLREGVSLPIDQPSYLPEFEESRDFSSGSVSIYIDEQRRFFVGYQNHRLEVGREDKPDEIFGVKNKRWARDHDLLEESKQYDEREIKDKNALFERLYSMRVGEVKRKIIGYCEEMGIELPKSWARMKYRPGITNKRNKLTGLEKIIRWYAEEKLKKLFGEVDIEGLSFLDWPIWPITASGQIDVNLIQWFNIPASRASPEYLRAKKVSLRELFPLIRPGIRVLDIGTAEGSFLENLARLNPTAIELTGIDRAIDQDWERHFKIRQVQINLLRKDGAGTGFDERYFDIVTINYPNSQMNLGAVFLEVKKVLINAGAFYLVTDSNELAVEAIELLEKLGFTDIDKQPVPQYWPYTPFAAQSSRSRHILVSAINSKQKLLFSRPNVSVELPAFLIGAEGKDNVVITAEGFNVGSILSYLKDKYHEFIFGAGIRVFVNGNSASLSTSLKEADKVLILPRQSELKQSEGHAIGYLGNFSPQEIKKYEDGVANSAISLEPIQRFNTLKIDLDSRGKPVKFYKMNFAGRAPPGIFAIRTEEELQIILTEENFIEDRLTGVLPDLPEAEKLQIALQIISSHEDTEIDLIEKGFSLTEAHNEASRLTKQKYGDKYPEIITALQTSRKLKGLILAASLVDIGAEITPDNKVISVDSINKIRELLSLIAASGVGSLYMYGGLYEKGGITVVLHQVPDAGRHFISGGQATISVINYYTKRANINGVELRDFFGNSFSILGMIKEDGRVRFNPELSGPESDLEEDFKKLIEEAHQLGIKIIVDFIPWLAPDAINESNYKWTFYYELSPEQNADYRSKPDEEKKRFIERLAEEDGAFAVVKITENGQERLIRVKYLPGAFGAYNVDEIVLNPLLPEVQKYYADSLKALVDLGVDGVRVDLAHLLLRDNLRRNHGGLLRVDTNFDGEPWKYIIEGAKRYARDNGRQLEFIMETYQPDDKEALFGLGADKVYYKDLFDVYLRRGLAWELAHQIKSIILAKLFGEGRQLLVFLSNFDEYSLKAVGRQREGASMLLAVLAHLGIPVMVDSREWLGHYGHIVPIVGGADRHFFVDSSELPKRSNFQKLMESFEQAPWVKLAERFFDTITTEKEQRIEFLDNQNLGRYISFGWKAEDGSWGIFVFNTHPEWGGDSIWVQNPQTPESPIEIGFYPKEEYKLIKLSAYPQNTESLDSFGLSQDGINSGASVQTRGFHRLENGRLLPGPFRMDEDFNPLALLGIHHLRQRSSSEPGSAGRRIGGAQDKEQRKRNRDLEKRMNAELTKIQAAYFMCLEALDIAREVDYRYPEIESFIPIAQLFIALGKPEEAEKIVEECLRVIEENKYYREHDNKRAEAYVYIIPLLIVLGRNLKAQKIAEEVSSYANDKRAVYDLKLKALILLVQIHIALGNLEEAKKISAQIVSIAEGVRDGQISLSDAQVIFSSLTPVLIALGDLAGAKKITEDAISQNFFFVQGEPEIFVSIVKAFITAGKIEEANEIVEKASVTRKPRFVQDYREKYFIFSRIQVQIALGNMEQARKMTKEAARESAYSSLDDWHTIKYLILLVQILFALGDLKNAYKVIDKLSSVLRGYNFDSHKAISFAALGQALVDSARIGQFKTSQALEGIDKIVGDIEKRTQLKKKEFAQVFIALMLFRGFNFSELKEDIICDKLIRFINQSGANISNNSPFLNKLAKHNIVAMLDSISEYFVQLQISLYLPKIFKYFRKLKGEERARFIRNFKEYYFSL